MGAKSELEYEAVNVRVDTYAESWGRSPALAKAANDMASKGWTLISCSHPTEKWAVLMFSRPRPKVSDVGVQKPHAVIEGLVNAAKIPAANLLNCSIGSRYMQHSSSGDGQ